MGIPVVRKPTEIDVEGCYFCKYMTRFWHEETNSPVCSVCAKRHEASELPNWRKNASTANQQQEGE